MNTFPEITIREGNVVAFPEAVPPASVLLEKDAVIDALNSDRISLNYQPQFSLVGGEMIGAEALLRMRDGMGNLMNAASVVEIAEQERLIDWLGHGVLKEACREFANLRSQGLRLPRMAINVSPLELRQSDYADGVLRAITEVGLDCEDIELEITESATLADPTLNLAHLHHLAESGVSIAIDDFGSGHTAWGHVLALPVSTLKIDRSLISQVLLSKKAAIVIQHICATARELGMDVVGEGVNSSEQRYALRDMGCTIGQGFGLARPMQASLLLDLPRVARV